MKAAELLPTPAREDAPPTPPVPGWRAAIGAAVASAAISVEAAEIIRTTGGHHFDGDYAALAARIIDGIERRAPGSVPPLTASPAP